jgi:hypothetical protein
MDEQRRAVKVAEPTLKEEKLASKARENALKEFAKALTWWFEMTKPEAEAVANEACPKEVPAAKVKAAPTTEEGAGEGEVEPEGNGGKVSEGQSVEDMLREVPED